MLGIGRPSCSLYNDGGVCFIHQWSCVAVGISKLEGAVTRAPGAGDSKPVRRRGSPLIAFLSYLSDSVPTRIYIKCLSHEIIQLYCSLSLQPSRILFSLFFFFFIIILESRFYNNFLANKKLICNIF